MRDTVERLSMKRVSACNVGLGQGDSAEQAAPPGGGLRPGAGARGAGHYHPGRAPGGAPEAEAARLRDLLPVALGRGVQLTVETHVGRLTEVPEVAVRLCREAQGVGLTLDPSHFHAGPNQGADFTAVFPYVRHVHLRDAGERGEEIQVPAGSGEVDFDALVRGLHGAGYEGKFAIEYIDSIPIVPRRRAGREPLGCARQRAAHAGHLRRRRAGGGDRQGMIWSPGRVPAPGGDVRARGHLEPEAAPLPW